MLDLSLVNAFRSGFESENMKIGELIVEPKVWNVAQIISRFMRLVNLDALQDYDHLKTLCVLARESVIHGDDEDGINSLPAMMTTRATSQDALALASTLAAITSLNARSDGGRESTSTQLGPRD